MKIRKRYILLILIALLPLHKFIHQEDYCFGEDDWVIIGVYATLFFVAFLAIIFNNFYMITLKKELFNIRPVIIGVVYTIGLVFFIFYHNDLPFKTKTQLFLLLDDELDPTEIQLFEDNTFQYQKTSNRIISNNLVTTICYSKGSFDIRNDSIYFNFNNSTLNGSYLDNVYAISASKDTLYPKNGNFLNYKLRESKKN